MKIGNIETKGNIFLAPLAGYTDVGMRYLCVKYGADLTVSEMVSAKALNYHNPNTLNLLDTAPNENPVAVQLFGSCGADFAQAVRNPALSKFDIIDINAGCPMPKIYKNGDGSALLENVEALRDVVSSAAKATDKPITVKIRVGVTDGSLAVPAAITAEQAGASAICVHGRTRVQLYSGTVDYADITAVKKAVSIPVIGNGDVTDKESYQRMLDCGVDGVMIGRGAMGNPYLFSQLKGIPYELTLKDDINKHIELLSKCYPERIVVNCMKKHICHYATHTRHTKIVKNAVNCATSFEDLQRIIIEYFAAY